MKREERRRQILSCARDVFAEKGFHATGVSDIIEAANIARGTFYHHFASKRAILDEILDEVFEQILSQVRPIEVPKPFDAEAVLDQIRGNLRRSFTPFFSSPEFAKILVSEAVGLDEECDRKLSGFYLRLHDWIALSLRKGTELGIVREEREDIVATLLIGMIKEVLYFWAVGGVEVNPEHAVETLLALARRGLLKEPD